MSVSVGTVMWVVALLNGVTAALLTWVVFATLATGRRLTRLEEDFDRRRRLQSQLETLRKLKP